MSEPRLQMRYYYLGTGDVIEEFRFVRPNGAGGRWQSTPYLAWCEWRRWLRSA